jgi:ankyrin repeat protein
MTTGPWKDRINHFKQVIYLFVLLGFSVCQAGSYDDFFFALKQDDPAKVSALLRRGFDPNTVDPSSTPALITAINASSFNVAAMLVQWPTTQVEVRNSADESPLMLAALKGELILCQALIKRGGDVNKPGWAPLHYAATSENINVVRLLLEENAYIDAASPNGTTPMMMAAHYGSDAAVKLLLEAGADPQLKNELGLSALDFANRANRPTPAELIAAAIRARQPKGTW